MPIRCRCDLRRVDLVAVDEPPDLSEKQTLAPPSAVGDETHHPGGELHSLDPKEEPSAAGEDNEGDLPRNSWRECHRLPALTQPVSISLNQE